MFALISPVGSLPVYESRHRPTLASLVGFLSQETLPEEMSVSFEGSLIRFHSKFERAYFVMGLERPR